MNNFLEPHLLVHSPGGCNGKTQESDHNLFDPSLLGSELMFF